jgi:hypothetical protein
MGKKTRIEKEDVLDISGIEINFALTNDGQMIIFMNSLRKVFGTSQKARDAKWLTRIASKGESRTLDIINKKIETVDSAGNVRIGYDCDIVPELCREIIIAGNSGELNHKQEFLYEVAATLMTGFAAVGLRTLLYKQLGYDLNVSLNPFKIMEQFVNQIPGKYASVFHKEFYEQIIRLKGLEIDLPDFIRKRSNQPMIYNLIYRRMPKLVYDRLKEVNPIVEYRSDDGAVILAANAPDDIDTSKYRLIRARVHACHMTESAKQNVRSMINSFCAIARGYGDGEWKKFLKHWESSYPYAWLHKKKK